MVTLHSQPIAMENIVSSNRGEATYTYLALGDSYTIGEGVDEHERWSAQLVDILKQNGKIVSSLHIVAKTGWTTDELMGAIQAEKIKNTYSFVSLLIGVNNQYRGESLDKFRQEFRQLLTTAALFAAQRQSHVFVLSIPDWGVTPFAESLNREQIAREIDAFNNVAAAECESAGIIFMDITTLSRKALNDPSMIASDDLHFSGKMYRHWAEKALPVVIEMLTTR